jgi:hypothetical protein
MVEAKACFALTIKKSQTQKTTDSHYIFSLSKAQCVRCHDNRFILSVESKGKQSLVKNKETDSNKGGVVS